MKATSFQFHDVVDTDRADLSGFPGATSANYKLTMAEFEAHLSILRKVLTRNPLIVLNMTSSPGQKDDVLLTFDDGGLSAYTHILDVLDRYGWQGHFFIPTSYIGHPTFVNRAHIRAIRERGHVIGSHSCSHPERMSYLGLDEMIFEWTTSITCLADILGEPVSVASVPHGYYSDKVAEAASYSGITALFTSEPVRKTSVVQGCMVLGRYLIRPGMDPGRSAELATGSAVAGCRQFLTWNVKKLAKLLGGRAYLKLRASLLSYAGR